MNGMDALIARKGDRYIMPFMFLAYLLNSMDRSNISFAALQIMREFGLSGTAFGAMGGVFFVGYILCELPVAWLMTRIGPRRTFARIILGWGMVSTLMAAVTAPSGFYILRFLLGVCEAGFAPCCFYYLSLWYTAPRMARALSIQQVSAPLASVIGGPLSGWIMLHLDGMWHLSGWRWMFAIEGGSSILLGLFVWRYLPDGVASVSWLTQAEKSYLLTTHASARGARDPSMAGWRTLRQLVVPALFYFTIMTGMYAINVWLPLIIADAAHGMNTMHVGFLYTIPYLLSIVAMLVWVRLPGVRGRWHGVIPAIASALCLLALVLHRGGLVMELACISGAMALMYAAYTIFWSGMINEQRATAGASPLAAVNMVGLCGGLIGPLMMGMMRDLTHDTRTGLVMAAVMILMGGMFYVLPVRTARNV